MREIIGICKEYLELLLMSTTMDASPSREKPIWST